MGIRNYLIKRGVYVAKHSNRYLLNRVLMDIFLKEELYKWIDKEINQTFTEVSLMITVAL